MRQLNKAEIKLLNKLPQLRILAANCGPDVQDSVATLLDIIGRFIITWYRKQSQGKKPARTRKEKRKKAVKSE